MFQCDKLCGDGTQRREVVCFHKVDGKIEKMSDGACPGEKPQSEMPCKLRPCEGVDWVTTKWSGVSPYKKLVYRLFWNSVQIWIGVQMWVFWELLRQGRSKLHQFFILAPKVAVEISVIHAGNYLDCNMMKLVLRNCIATF